MVQDQRIPGRRGGAGVGWPRWPRAAVRSPRGPSFSRTWSARRRCGSGWARRPSTASGPTSTGGWRARWPPTAGPWSSRPVTASWPAFAARRRRCAARRPSRARSPTTTARPATASRCGWRSAWATPSSRTATSRAPPSSRRPGCAPWPSRARSCAPRRCGRCRPTGRAAPSASPLGRAQGPAGAGGGARGGRRTRRRTGAPRVCRSACSGRSRSSATGAPWPWADRRSGWCWRCSCAGAGDVVSVDALVDAVWGETPPRTAERTVHAYIARLRRALEPGHRPGGTHDGRSRPWAAATGSAVERRAARRRPVRTLGPLRVPSSCGRRRGRAAAALRAALAEWRGDAYAGLADVGRCAAEAARLGAPAHALEDQIDADLAAGGRPTARGRARAAVREHPFRERLWGQLMVALYRSGRQGDALDAYQRARRVLVEELGIEPGPELRRLEAAILAQDPDLDWTPGAAHRRRSPRAPARARRRRPGVRRARPRAGVAAVGVGRRPRAATAASSRSSAPRASARPAWSPSWPGRRTTTARWCCTAAATTHTRAPGRWSTRRSRGGGGSSDGSTRR